METKNSTMRQRLCFGDEIAIDCVYVCELAGA